MTHLFCSPVTPSQAFVNLSTKHVLPDNVQPRPAPPTFRTAGSVTIGPYEGRLDYRRTDDARAAPRTPPRAAPPARRKADAASARSGRPPYGIVRIDQPRSWFRKALDRIFYGIRMDGTRDLTLAERRSFGQLETSIAAVANARPGDTASANAKALAQALHWHADPRAAHQEFGKLLKQARAGLHQLDDKVAAQAHQRSVWPRLIALATVPEVSRRLWSVSGQLAMIDLLQLCPDHTALMALASKHEDGEKGGLMYMTEDAAVMTMLIEPLLLDAIKPLAFHDAIRVLAPWGIESPDGPSLFRDSFGMRQCTRLENLLRSKAGESIRSLLALRDFVCTGSPAGNMSKESRTLYSNTLPVFHTT